MNINVLGYSIVVGSLVGLVVYFYLVFLSPWAFLVIRLSAFLAVTAVVVVVVWVKTTFTSAPSEDLGLEELDEGE